MNDSRESHAKALLLGARIDDRKLPTVSRLAHHPLLFPFGEGGHVVVLRFGAAVFFGLTPEEESRAFDWLKPWLIDPLAEPEREEATLVWDSEEDEGPDSEGTIHLGPHNPKRLQAVALILAKSTVLAHYETEVSAVFDRVEHLAGQLRDGRLGRDHRLLAQLGDVMLIQARTVGRVEVSEKPELAWDAPEVDRLYEQLAAEYELRERDRALTRKLDLISDVARTYHDVLQTRQGLRLEWYIVILILVEIVLIVWDIWGPSGH